MRWFFPSFLAALALALPVAAQQPAGARWTADSKTGCKVWNTHPKPRETVSWDGPCKGGIANGPGVAEWRQNGALLGRIEADYRNGRPEGRGLMSDKDGNRFEGEFVGGELNGRGIATMPNGARVTANYVAGKIQGRGVIAMPDGTRVDADFVDNEPVRGAAIYADGSRYEGEFRNLMRHGKGKIAFAKGGQYEGDFADNELHGEGTLLFANGDRYEGGWRRNRPHGRGTSRIAGRQNSGIWEMGCLFPANSDYNLGSTLIVGAAACGFQ